MDMRDGADWVQVLLHRLFERSLALGEDGDQAAGGVGLFDEADGGLPRHREGHEGIGKKNCVSKWQDRQFCGNLERPLRVQQLADRPLLICLAHTEPSLPDLLGLSPACR